MAQTTNIVEMEKIVLASLDDVPLQQICRCVSLFSLYPHYSYHSFILAMQTDQHDSSQPTHKAFWEHKLFGLTKSTMDTILYLPTSSLLSRSPLHCNLGEVSILQQSNIPHLLLGTTISVSISSALCHLLPPFQWSSLAWSVPPCCLRGLSFGRFNVICI